MVDYTELNDVEAGCDVVPVDYPDYEKGLALAANAHKYSPSQLAYFRCVKMAEVFEEWQRNNPLPDVSFKDYVASQFGADVDDDYVYQALSDEEV